MCLQKIKHSTTRLVMACNGRGSQDGAKASNPWCVEGKAVLSLQAFRKILEKEPQGPCGR